MRFDPLFDDLSYGLPSSPVEASIGGTRYIASAAHDSDGDRFHYRLTIAPPGCAPIAVSAIRLGLFGRHKGARVAWRGATATVRDTAEIEEAAVRAAVEMALTRASDIGTAATRPAGGTRRDTAARYRPVDPAASDPTH